MTITHAATYIEAYTGEAGETVRLAELPRAAIDVPKFQRERKAHHRKIAGEFDRTAYVLPVVLAWEDGYIAIDGQQRLAACELRGQDTVVVLLVEGITKQERAAALYLMFNRDRRGLNAFEKFTGAHAARDPGTLEIARILRECGLRAAKSAGAGSDCVPIGAVTVIHSRYGIDVLVSVLETRELAWGDANERESRESKTLYGLAVFLRSYWDRVDLPTLIDVLRKVHPASLISKVEGNKHGSFEGRYSDYVRDLYNRRFPRGKRRL